VCPPGRFLLARYNARVENSFKCQILLAWAKLAHCRTCNPLPGWHMILNIERKQLPNNVVVFQMTGRIILGNNSRNVELDLAKALNENLHKVIFDLAGVTLLDSTGVGIIVVCHAKLKKVGGELRVAGATGMVDETLRMTSLDRIVHFYPSVADAASNF
jgi:anti-sigma B factor antagonist